MDDRERNLHLHSLTDEEREALISGPARERWTRVGECNKCGECCRTLVSTWFMTGYDRERGPRTTGCLHLEEQPDGRYECLIRSGEIAFDGLSQQVREYYLEECLGYPDPSDPAQCPPRHNLPEKCGYRIVEAE